MLRSIGGSSAGSTTRQVTTCLGQYVAIHPCVLEACSQDVLEAAEMVVYVVVVNGLADQLAAELLDLMAVSLPSEETIGILQFGDPLLSLSGTQRTDSSCCKDWVWSPTELL
jgi:hypothetical protein